MPRVSGRSANQLRDIKVTKNYIAHAHGSVLFQMGGTKVLCAASIENKVPPFLRDKGQGWVTAEYGMLPRSTNTRTDRKRASSSGRTQEIQRLIGRSLRAVTKLRAFGERQIKIDCDVIQADGGTRTAAVTGGFVALHLAFQHLMAVGVIKEIPLTESVAAVSCGLWHGVPVLDLDYAEDSTADADANFVLTASENIIEIQGTAETKPFSKEAFQQLHKLANKGTSQLLLAQRVALDLA